MSKPPNRKNTSFPNSYEEHLRAFVEKADHFTANGFGGIGRKETVQCATLDEAIQAGAVLAQKMRRPAAIYAVQLIGTGQAMHVMTVDANGKQTILPKNIAERSYKPNG